VPQTEKLVLNFVLSYLEAEALPAQLLVNGGYVRDLLLGKTPDDLDLSLDLHTCPPHVTIDSLLTDLVEFARKRPDLNVSSVNVTTILSDTSKDKNVDTAKAHLIVGSPPERIEVDFMPTIGEETYDERDRVPLRDVRGTPEQDALRRDLTIGAMLLEISRGSGGSAPVAGGDAADAADAAEALQWRLLDYYGGLADLRAGILRSPYPANRPLIEVWADVMRASEDQNLAAMLGLSPTPDPDDPNLPIDNCPPEAVLASAMSDSDSDALAQSLCPTTAEATTLQIVWWVKVLKDDPLRLLRALRFAAKLRFELHPTFWLAVPFALSPLQSKVAGSRKNTELLKLAKAGTTPLLDFLQLSFGRPVPPSSSGDEGEGGSPSSDTNTLATCLFGGADPKGEARFLDAPNGFDQKMMRKVAACLPEGLGEDEALGSGLAAAAIACLRPWGTSEEQQAVDVTMGEASGDAGQPIIVVTDPEDDAAAVAAEAAMAQLSAACDGLCASRDLRAAAETPLYCAASLLQPVASSGMNTLFAEAASEAAVGGGSSDGGGGGVSTEEFTQMVHMWDTLKLEKWLIGKAGAGYHPQFIVSLAGARASGKTRTALSERLERLLTAEGVAINGKALVGLPKIPPPLRGLVISQLQVLTRLRGDGPSLGELSKADQLEAYLEERCGGLLTKLYGEWYEDGGKQLRPAYAPSKRGKGAK
jgi:hypothetical protein